MLAPRPATWAAVKGSGPFCVQFNPCGDISAQLWEVKHKCACIRYAKLLRPNESNDVLGLILYRERVCVAPHCS